LWAKSLATCYNEKGSYFKKLTNFCRPMAGYKACNMRTAAGKRLQIVAGIQAVKNIANRPD
jgi:hypothetical protein